MVGGALSVQGLVVPKADSNPDKEPEADDPVLLEGRPDVFPNPVVRIRNRT